ncbi:MAG: hypothetical protein ACI86C_000088 [Candidatus Latescibacterota bacterium]|jgi:hypothetical protein
MQLSFALILGLLFIPNIHAQEEVFSFLQDDRTTFNRQNSHVLLREKT